MDPEQRRLQDQIDDLADMPSDRPTPVEIHFDRSVRPKKPDSLWVKVAAAIAGVGAIAETIHQAWLAWKK